MKYLETANYGDVFWFNNQYFLLTDTFKNNGKHLCINLVDGKSNWIDGSAIVSIEPIYILDKDNNIVGLKNRVK